MSDTTTTDAGPRVGFLHPGKMGSAMAHQASGESLWCSSGRSGDTIDRANQAGLDDAGTLTQLVAASDILISICPPDAAEDVADQVASIGFDGIYCDANAISPDRSRSIGARFANYVDGGVVGPPPTIPGAARLYLSGTRADEIAAIWEGSHLEPITIGDHPGAASALKMAYAAWTKGSSALLLAIHALANAEGVATPLLTEWERSQPELVGRTEGARRGATPKAWRFAGEMDEIASSFHAVGLPDGFHAGASDIYQRLAEFKNADPAPALDEIVAALNRK